MYQLHFSERFSELNMPPKRPAKTESEQETKCSKKLEKTIKQLKIILCKMFRNIKLDALKINFTINGYLAIQIKS